MVAIAEALRGQPYRLFSLSSFAEQLGAAKSTISEDLAGLKAAFERFGLGRVETLAGAAGGVRYVPHRTAAQVKALVEDLVQRLAERERVLPGGFLYTTDLVSTPVLAWQIGETFATAFGDARPDAILAMEVKGIPLAFMTARAFSVPTVVIRRGGRITEGSSVTVNYVSGSRRTVESMTLPVRAVKPGWRLLFIDDFIRGGGTAIGAHDLMREVGAEVSGVGVMIETPSEARRIPSRLVSLVTYRGVGSDGRPLVAPSPSVGSL